MEASTCWKSPGGKEIRSGTPAGRIAAYEFSTDGRWFGMGLANGGVEVWPTDSAHEPIQWTSGDRSVELLKFLPASNVVIVGPLDRPGQVWDFSSTPVLKGRLDTDFAGLTAAAVSPDGKMLATANADTAVRIFDTGTWKQLREYRGLMLEPFAIAFTNDGKYTIVGGADGQLTLLDPWTGKEIRKLAVQPDPVQEISPIDNDRLAVLYMDADGRKPPHLQVWSLQAGTTKPVAMDAKVTGGGVANGKMWFVTANPTAIELRSGE